MLAGGLPANQGFETAFLVSAAVALLAGLCGLLIPTARAARASGLRAAIATEG